MLNTRYEIRDTARRLTVAVEESQGWNLEDGPSPVQLVEQDLRNCVMGDPGIIRRMSLRNLFIESVANGYEAIREMESRNRDGGVFLTEAGASVSTSVFNDIIGQVTYASVMDGYDEAAQIGSQLTTLETATTGQSEQVPGITPIGDQAESVGEGEEYPRVGVGRQYIVVPEKIKQGFVIDVTEEAIFEDKTGQLNSRVSEGARWLGINQEKEMLDVCLGVTTSYSRNGGPVQATYGDTHTQGTFDNLAASLPLTSNYQDIETALLLFDAMTDPDTGEPIVVTNGTLDLVVPSALLMTARNAVNATEIQQGTRHATTPINTSPNPLNGGAPAINIISSPYINARQGNPTTWYIGQFKRAFKYHQIYPIQMFQTDANTEAGFNRDVVAAFKVRRRGVTAVHDPRYVVKCTSS